MAVENDPGVGDSSRSGVPKRRLLRVKVALHGGNRESGGGVAAGEAVVLVRVRALDVSDALQRLGKGHADGQRVKSAQSVLPSLRMISLERKQDAGGKKRSRTRAGSKLGPAVVGVDKGWEKNRDSSERAKKKFAHGRSVYTAAREPLELGTRSSELGIRD